MLTIRLPKKALPENERKRIEIKGASGDKRIEGKSRSDRDRGSKGSGTRGSDAKSEASREEGPKDDASS